MSVTTYTQEQVQEQVNQAITEAKQAWEKDILNPVITERDNLMQYKPVELSEEQKQIKQLKADLMQAKAVAALRDADLDDFVDFLNVENEEELQVKIDKLSKVINDRKLNNRYIPSEHRQTGAYSNAQSKGDTVGMIQAKFQKLFNQQ
ncbi:hypothetical protein [Paenibacillus bouchesdurhonensis]|uniref:hypothetical protein n=1 Tax=Paenibacillus bouchesdurhonensis TaxID=1870990 RepID=UPI000DA5FF16|nr:hypothetical protein [Paenibacillus bouchesdurhonensis]